ncbi:hypothetical protein V6Z12_A12G243700 [Gossypium hirsutum]
MRPGLTTLPFNLSLTEQQPAFYKPKTPKGVHRVIEACKEKKGLPILKNYVSIDIDLIFWNFHIRNFENIRQASPIHTSN